MKKLNMGKQMTSVWKMAAPSRSEKALGKHPTQKPLSLLERIIAASSREADCVLDPFAGSSSTGVAAMRLNRRFVGVETEDEYLALSVRRLESAQESPSDLLQMEHEVANTTQKRLTQGRLL
jgi:site-specific DNA-methyltransferase (adenine-specific)